MDQLFFVLGSLSGGVAVALGAFGAHALKARLTVDRLATFETGVRYQMYHALALLGVTAAIARWPASNFAEHRGLAVRGRDGVVFRQPVLTVYHAETLVGSHHSIWRTGFHCRLAVPRIDSRPSQTEATVAILK